MSVSVPVEEEMGSILRCMIVSRACDLELDLGSERIQPREWERCGAEG